MIDLRRIFTKNKPTSGRAVQGQPVARKFFRARFDAASNSPDNAKHWSAAEYLSADAEANESVRKVLRTRARYEVANNSYAKGMVLTLANDTIGTGPRLQVLSDDEITNSAIERDFTRWSLLVDLAGKLRTMRMARCQDGESFISIVTNPSLDHSVKLDIQVIEADRVTNTEMNFDPAWVDGIRFDDYGNPVSYRVLKHHPGGNDFLVDTETYRDIDAQFMIHYFRVDRPGLHRGIPEITPALPLFAQLRRYTLAVLSAAEAAADFAGILYTDNPVSGESDSVEPLDSFELERNMLLTMPAGWKMGQLDPKQPTSTYSEFKTQILNEIARCLNMPFNIAAGNSSGYNYASGRLDHQTYFKSLRVEQDYIGTRVLDRIFREWLKEYAVTKGIDAEQFVSHVWFWDGFEHVDPGKEANATDTKLKNHTTTLAAEYGKIGRDWESALVQIAKEQKKMRELGITSTENIPGAVWNIQEDEEDTEE